MYHCIVIINLNKIIKVGRYVIQICLWVSPLFINLFNLNSFRLLKSHFNPTPQRYILFSFFCTQNPNFFMFPLAFCFYLPYLCGKLLRWKEVKNSQLIGGCSGSRSLTRTRWTWQEKSCRYTTGTWSP